MKKLKVVMLLLVVSVLMLFSLNMVSADSGWDTDYDSGSSWDYGSDWDSGSSWDRNYSNDRSSYNSSDGSSLFSFGFEQFLLVLIVIAFYFLKWILGNVINDAKISARRRKELRNDEEFYKHLLKKEITDEEANSVIPNFNIEEFKQKAYEIFREVQRAWMYFDYDKLKELVSDELYNTYVMDLEVLRIKNRRNVMSDFEKLEVKLIGLKQENNQFIATVLLNTKFYDYVEDNRRVVFRGNSKIKVNNIYSLTFVKSVNEEKINICPKCGAEVKGNITGICKYCRTKITFDNYDWVMSKKTKIIQR